MPHLFLPLDRPRKYALGVGSTLSSHEFWEDLNAWTYLIGGFMFVIGSVFFLPQYDDLEPVGSWIFFVASIFYLIVALHDAAELAYHNEGHLPPNIDSAAALNYIVGSILFMMGSVFFLPNVGMYTGGAWCFIVGSLCFVVGAVLNGMQIFDAQTKRDAQYLLLTAMCYIIGSVMFLVPSIPYLFDFDTISDKDEIYTFLAAIYVAGSCCFTVGGCINFHRSRAFRQLQETFGGVKDEPAAAAEEDQPDKKPPFPSKNDEGGGHKEQQQRPEQPPFSSVTTERTV